MKRLYLLSAFGVVSSILPLLAQPGFGNARKLNHGWLFQLSDTIWRPVSLPHDWSIEGIASPDLASGTGYLPGGIGHYRRIICLDSLAINSNLDSETAEDSKQVKDLQSDRRKYYIYFEGVYNRSDVYINSHHLGHRPNGYASFMYDLTPYLHEGDNLLEVKVDHSRFADSRYYTGSGIYRDVWLIDAPESHISLWGVGFTTEKVSGNKAIVKVDVEIEKPVKGMSVRATLTNPPGKQVATSSMPATEVSSLTMKVPDPVLWDIDDPQLYTLHIELIDKGITIDSNEAKVGIRTLAFSPDNGFFLNGRNRKVKGVCIHHDAGMLGAAVPPEIWEHRLRNLKKLGVNALRMSHNPQAPAVYDIADRLGLLIMDEASDEWEFPKRKWVKGWNKGTPSFDGSFDFFEEWIDRDVADMVRRDRLHPSVFLWSIGNEVDYPNDPYSHPILDGDNSAISQPMYGGYNPDAPDAMRIGEIAKRLSGVVRGIDTSRPTTGALAGVVMSNCTAYPEAVDVVGYNYTEDRYDIDHATYPDRVIYGSENRSDYDAWKAVRDKDFIFGQFIWTGIDYLGESGEWPSRGLYTGLLDFTGYPKPRGMFRASLWSDSPLTYIGTYRIPGRRSSNPARNEWLSIDAWDTWNYEPSDTVRVVCYTTSPLARLVLTPSDSSESQVRGELSPKPDDSGIIHWDIPFIPGRLTAQGLSLDGSVESEYSIYTSGLPHTLQARLISEAIDPGEVAQIEILVTDEQGIPVKLADNMVEVKVEGGAELMALDSGDNSDMTNTNYLRFGSYSTGATPQSDVNGKHHRRYSPTGKRRAFRGRLVAYVHITNPEQPATIHVASPLLRSAHLKLH